LTIACALALLFTPLAQTDHGIDVYTPPSSIEHPGDRGIRAHTNHLVYVGPKRPRIFDGPGRPLTNAPILPPDGYTPEEIRDAYEVSPIGGGGAIAVVDAFHYPTSLNDFNVFSQTFNLLQEPSTNPTASSNKVFQVVYQSSSQPASNASWAQEAALDIEWAHSMSRYAKIYLVEANSANLSDLFAAVQKAETLPGVREISMSFGASEFSGERSFDSTFVKSGITFFAAAGDTAAVTQYPALSPNVVGVGGTTLSLTSSGRVASEIAWNDTGGGLSSFEPIPSYQTVIAGILGHFRGGPDVALNADPNTGCAVYDSTPLQGMSGWLVVGGTSLACPCVAGIANTSDRRFSSSALELTHIYQGLGKNFRDILFGSAGNNRAKAGWDFCTGVGCPLRNAGV